MDFSEQYIVNQADLDSLKSNRLDNFLNSKVSDFTRTSLKKFITQGLIMVNGKVVKPSQKLFVSDSVIVEIVVSDKKSKFEAEDIELDILHEDDDIIVLNKESRMVVHPACGNMSGTLVNALLYHSKELSGLNGDDRPGIVHRLDKDTSGAIVVAKNDKAHLHLSRQFMNKEIKKKYLCVTAGVPLDKIGKITSKISRNPLNRLKMTNTDRPNGKNAITIYKVLNFDKKKKYSVIQCDLITGRTHQIRVHMKENLFCPILGDVIYGMGSYCKSLTKENEVSRLMLHSHKIEFNHPAKNKRIKFVAPLPSEFNRFVIFKKNYKND